MTIDTTWLKQICGDPVTRPSLSEPMTFERDGKQFTVATDGHRMVELPGNDGGFEPVPADAIPSLLKIVQPTPASAVPFNYAALKAFVTDELTLWRVPAAQKLLRLGNSQARDVQDAKFIRRLTARRTIKLPPSPAQFLAWYNRSRRKTVQA